MSCKMVLDGCTIYMGFGVSNIKLNPVKTGNWEIWCRWWRNRCRLVGCNRWSYSLYPTTIWRSPCIIGVTPATKIFFSGWLGGIRPIGGKNISSLMHKSFVLGFVFSLIPHRPWQLRGAPKIMILGRAVYLLIQDIPGDAGIFCANFGYSQRAWPPCQECWHGDWFSSNPDREPYYYGVMEDLEGIPCNSNTKYELRY